MELWHTISARQTALFCIVLSPKPQLFASAPPSGASVLGQRSRSGHWTEDREPGVLLPSSAGRGRQRDLRPGGSRSHRRLPEQGCPGSCLTTAHLPPPRWPHDPVGARGLRKPGGARRAARTVRGGRRGVRLARAARRGPRGSSAGPGEGPLCGCSWQDGAGGGGEEAAAGPQRACGGGRRRLDQ